MTCTDRSACACIKTSLIPCFCQTETDLNEYRDPDAQFILINYASF